MNTNKPSIKLWAAAGVALGILLSAISINANPAQSPDQGSPWKRYKLTGSSLTKVDATSPNDAWAVGSDGLFAHWNGTEWAAVDNTKLVGTSAVLALDMLSPSLGWAAGTNGRMLRYNGAAWSLDGGNLTANMNGISMVSATDGWAAGAAGAFARYDGSSWQQVAPSANLTVTMRGIDMVSSTDGWAVGGLTPPGEPPLGKIARFNGTAWQEFPSPVTNRILYAVDMLDSTYGWAVGQNGILLEWNGANWTQATAPTTAATMYGVHVVSRTDAWATGSTNISTANLWRWNGVGWSAVTTPLGAPLDDVVMLGADDGWIVGDRGTVYRKEGANLTVANSHWTQYGLYALDFLNPSDGWAVGVLNQNPPAYGLLHWDGAGWQTHQPPSFQPTAYDVDMVATDAAWVVGPVGYIFRWNGTAWTRDTSPNVSLYALSMVSATDGWAVGSSGNIARYNGTSWATYPSGTTTNLWSIDMVDENEGWAGGTLGLMLHYRNGAWTRITPNPASYTIEGIQMLDAGEGWAVGYNGTILHYLNGAWTPQASQTTNNLLNVHMLNSNEGWAVGVSATGAGATILHYLNGAWNLVPSPTGIDLRDVYMFDADSGWAVGTSPGPMLRYEPSTGGTPTPGATGTPPPPTATPTGTSVATSTATSTSTGVATSTPIVTATPPIATPTGTIASTSTPTSTRVATSTPTVTVTPCAFSFSDVHPMDYFYEGVRYLVCMGAVSGYSDGTFRPYNNTTRGQICKVVTLARGWALLNPEIPTFSDVPRGSTFYQFVETAYDRDVISGYTCGTGCLEFRSNNNVTRGQLAKIVVLTMEWPIDTTGGPHFYDVPVGSPFYEYIETVYNRMIARGYGNGTFRPGNPATRGQISVIVYRAVTAP